MMNDNSYFNGSSSVTPAGYAPISAPAAPEQGHSKKPLVIAVIILIPLAIIGVAVIVFTGQKGVTPRHSEDAEQIEYDVGDGDTGGEIEEVPVTKSLRFLRQYGVPEEDDTKIESQVRSALDQYYADAGYDSIIYDIKSVKMSRNKSDLSFRFTTDRNDMHFRVSLSLKDDHVGTIIITPADPIPTKK